MKEYGGYPDRWLDQDWSMTIQLLDVNNIIKRVQERERKKSEMRNKHSIKRPKRRR